MQGNLISRFSVWLHSPRHIAPLVVLRIAFGLILFLATLRFIAKGWVQNFYITPKFHFTFYGFEWVKPLGAAGMYSLFALMALAALFIALGFFYRVACAVFFASFTYFELIDKTYYLNHYYFVSLLAFLLLLVPAQGYFSLDALRKPGARRNYVPAWTIAIFKWQLFIVYFFAGLSKITPDWLLQAMPLKIWLPANAHLPLIGPLLEQAWVAYVFSWVGMLFDLSIVFLLMNNRTRPVAYAFVIVFHLLTAWFFKIGMFPVIMIGVTLIFFPEDVYIRLIGIMRSLFSKNNREEDPDAQQAFLPAAPDTKLIFALLAFYFLAQVFLPFRYLLYPGKLLWTEEGYRFSWRVMLMEKSGTSFFYVTDPQTGKSSEINNGDYLTPFQEKMMATQPDMILQYAHYLAEVYQKKGIADPMITVDSYVTLNGSGSRLFVKQNVNLAKEEESFHDKKWILPY